VCIRRHRVHGCANYAACACHSADVRAQRGGAHRVLVAAQAEVAMTRGQHGLGNVHGADLWGKGVKWGLSGMSGRSLRGARPGRSPAHPANSHLVLVNEANQAVLLSPGRRGRGSAHAHRPGPARAARAPSAVRTHALVSGHAAGGRLELGEHHVCGIGKGLTDRCVGLPRTVC
jgi:hypothetical protein